MNRCRISSCKFLWRRILFFIRSYYLPFYELSVWIRLIEMFSVSACFLFRSWWIKLGYCQVHYVYIYENSYSEDAECSLCSLAFKMVLAEWEFCCACGQTLRNTRIGEERMWFIKEAVWTKWNTVIRAYRNRSTKLTTTAEFLVNLTTRQKRSLLCVCSIQCTNLENVTNGE